MARNSPPLKIKRSKNLAKDLNLDELPRGVMIKHELIAPLERMAEERGIDITQLVNIRLQAMVFSFENGRVLGLTDPMPFGQYKGIIVEDLIRADGRYVRWLYSTSEIFELNDEAREFLETMS